MPIIEAAMASLASELGDWRDVDSRAACQLDLAHRIAWATEVLAKVVKMYSPYFRDKYKQDLAIHFARRFYLTAQIHEDERRCIIHDIEDLVDEAEAEGYSRNLLSPGVYLLLEIGSGDGKGCTNAVDYGSLSFAANVYFRQGVRGTGMPVEYGDGIANFLYAYAWRIFSLTLMYKNEPTTSIPFSSVPFITSVPALAKEDLARSRRNPPLAEVEYFAQIGANRLQENRLILDF